MGAKNRAISVLFLNMKIVIITQAAATNFTAFLHAYAEVIPWNFCEQESLFRDE